MLQKKWNTSYTVLFWNDFHLLQNFFFLISFFKNICFTVLFSWIIFTGDRQTSSRWCEEYKVADKILRHFLFFDFLYERSLIIDLQLAISIALEPSYKLQRKKANKYRYLNFYDRNRFLPEDKILRYFSISVIYLQKNLHKYNSIYKKSPPFACKHSCIRSNIDSTNFMYNFWSVLSYFSWSPSIRVVLE